MSSLLPTKNKYTDRSAITHGILFDAWEYSIYDEEMLNLTAGAPGPDLLKECSEIFNVATAHRMVTKFYQYYELYF